MKRFIKENWKFILFVVIAGFIGGYYTALYLYDSLTNVILKQLQDQNVTKNMYAIISSVQVGIMYGLLLSILGIILSKKVNLWRSFKLEKKTIIITIIIGLIAGLILYPGDKILFGSIEMVKKSYMVKPTFNYFMCSLFYGGIIEEVMMRLFLMSLLSFIIYKIFYKKEKECPTKVFIIVNIICAILFAAGHLPSTMAMTTLTPLIIFRCFLLNSIFGLAFGYLYHKYGIGYSMMCHSLCHLISKMLMLIFI